MYNQIYYNRKKSTRKKLSNKKNRNQDCFPRNQYVFVIKTFSLNKYQQASKTLQSILKCLIK